MSSQPALLDREARGIHAGLKAILSRDVWSNYREADFQRKNLRRRYLQLLLLHPSSKEAKDAGTHLWMQTSYAFIALYKQRLLRSNNNSNNNPVEARKLHQRFRQFLAEEERFWQALVLRVQRTYAIALPTSVPLPPELSGVGVDEEAAAAVDAHSPERARNNDFGFLNASDPPANVDLSPSTAASILGKALICLGDIARYREQYRPAPHTPAHIPEPKKKLYEHKPNYNRARMLYLAAQALAPEEGNAAHQLAILAGYEGDTLASVTWYFRALCVPAPFDTAGENLAGVLTRALAHPQAKAVAENEEQLLEKEREEEAEPLRVRVEKFKKDLVLLHAVSRERESSPTTQLALSKHAARVFAALVSARALPEEMIVRVGMVAQGALWIGVHSPVTGNNSKADDREREDNEDSVKGKEKEKRRSKHKPAVPTTTILPFAPGPASPQQQQQHLAHLLQLHTALLDVGIRELGEVDVYVGVPVVTTAPIPLPQPQPHVHVAGGRSRRTRPGRSHPNPTHNHPVPIPAVSRPVEELQQTQTPAKTKTTKKTELAERITAVFRRTLPALRVGSKWLLANWGLVDAGAAARDREQEREGSEKELETFWSTYAQFLRLLAKTFPEEELPTLTVAVAVSDGDGGSDGHESEQLDVDAELELEEDLDMRGWLPLRGLMGGPLDGDQEQAGRRRHVIGLNEEVHPNVEHLMRIRDLLRDGRKIAGMEGSPLAMYGGKFVAKGIEAEKGSPLARYGGKFKGIEAVSVPVVPRVPVPTLASIRDSSLALRDAQELEDNDDAMTEQTSRTADEIIHDAFSFLDNQGDEEEEVRVALGGGGGDSDEDEIVWDPRAASAPAPVPVPVPASPIVVPTTARTSPKTPIRPPPISPPSRTTAIGVGSAISPLRPPPPLVSPGMQVPGTTALDLLNKALSKVPKPMPAPPPPISTGTGLPISMTMGVASGESLMFSSRSPAQQTQTQMQMQMQMQNQQQSIWSAARDEPGLMFSAGPGPIGPPQGQGQGQGQAQGFSSHAYLPPAHQHQHQHQRFASQDIHSPQSTIWSSSAQESHGRHYNVPVGPIQQPYPISTQVHPTHHQRAVSSSMAAAQLFGGGYGSMPLSAVPPGTGTFGRGHEQHPVNGNGSLSPIQMHMQMYQQQTPMSMQQDPFGVFYSSSSPVATAGPYARQNLNSG